MINKDKMQRWVKKAQTAIKWVAVDQSGAVFGYNKKPTALGDSWWCTSYKDDEVYLGDVKSYELRKNWEETLTEVKYENRSKHKSA